MLTNPVLDPFGKIPEFKYCAVRVAKGGAVPEHSSFGGGSLLPVQLRISPPKVCTWWTLPTRGVTVSTRIR